MLATADGRNLSRVAALLRWRPLGLLGRWLVLAVGLLVGLGAVPLWPLVYAPALRLGLDARPGLGTGLGDVADDRGRMRLGAAAAARRL